MRVVPEKEKGKGFWQGRGEKLYGVAAINDAENPFVCYLPYMPKKISLVATKLDFGGRRIWHLGWFAALRGPYEEICCQEVGSRRKEEFVFVLLHPLSLSWQFPSSLVVEGFWCFSKHVRLSVIIPLWCYSIKT